MANGIHDDILFRPLGDESPFTFEWSRAKSFSNFKKHGISFEECTGIFSDLHSITVFDFDHSEIEDRFYTIGLAKTGRLIVAVHTDRLELIRIISARFATKNEENQYHTGRS